MASILGELIVIYSLYHMFCPEHYSKHYDCIYFE